MNIAEPLESCENCSMFFQSNRMKDMDVGECHRFPPSCVWDNNEMGVDNRWPLVRRNDICGEYTPKEEDESKYEL